MYYAYTPPNRTRLACLHPSINYTCTLSYIYINQKKLFCNHHISVRVAGKRGNDEEIEQMIYTLYVCMSSLAFKKICEFVQGRAKVLR